MDNKNLGQYFTTNRELREVVYGFIKNNPKVILEPSLGRGDLIQDIICKKKNVEFDMYEIDSTIRFSKNDYKTIC